MIDKTNYDKFVEAIENLDNTDFNIEKQLNHIYLSTIACMLCKLVDIFENK